MREGGDGLAAARATIAKRRRAKVHRKQGNGAANGALPPVSTRSVEDLEQQLAGGLVGANALPALLTHIRPNTEGCVRAMHAARRALGALEKYASADDTFQKWHAARSRDFRLVAARVAGAAASSDEEVDTAVALCALEGSEAWLAVVKEALCAADGRAMDTVGDCFASKYADLRRLALRALAAARNFDHDRALTLLSHCTKAPLHDAVGKEDGGGGVEESKALRVAYGKAWLRVLGAGLATEKLVGALRTLPTDVLPRVHTPLSFADALTCCYNAREPHVAVCALDALFYLIARHGLDYPNFYAKLYQLLTPEALWGCGSSLRFLDLVAKFLCQGEFIAGAVAASFVKRLARRALLAPPERALWCLRLALDILHRHPAVHYLVHRSVSLFDAPKAAMQTTRRAAQYKGADPYDDDADDPAASGAADSSLWELECLRKHISPSVTRLVAAFSRDVRKQPMPPPGSVSDYTKLTFADIFESEFRRRPKSTPIAYDAPGCAAGMREVDEELEGVLIWS